MGISSSNTATSTRAFLHSAYPILLGSFIGIWLIFFLPAGTLRYWEAWVLYMLICAVVFHQFRYLIQQDPKLLERRMRSVEKERSQKYLINGAILVFVVVFLIPGLDHRFGWSNIPVTLVLGADVLIFAGYGLFFRVLKENTYASRVIEVMDAQKIISTGPYAIVRHPMYLAYFVMLVLAPLALGSYYGFLPVLILMPLVLGYRALKEEELLIRELPGYAEYVQSVRWRIVPYVW